LVAKRIEELQARNERKAEMAAMTRDELTEILTDIVHATRARLSEARPGDGLKAAEMLAKMCGWNEPERVNVQSVELRVDAALIEQLRAGYARARLANEAPACLGPGCRPQVGEGPVRGHPSKEEAPLAQSRLQRQRSRFDC
jgi:hypothetical protein